MILDFKLAQMWELHKRYSDRVHGVFFTDDWGTQQAIFVPLSIFRKFFYPRYEQLISEVHGYGYHFILHTCGKVNELVPLFIELGVDVLNMQQPRVYGIEEIGERFAGRVCFLTTADIQNTLPKNDPELVREEVELLVKSWSTPEGGFIVFNYGDPKAIGVTSEITRVMFHAFRDFMHYWRCRGIGDRGCGRDRGGEI